MSTKYRQGAPRGPTLTLSVGANTGVSVPAASAVSGVRSEGWLPQSRAEVMSTHGMVSTSQPLAAQAGLQILKAGGNAIDAAVATAAMLSLVEPCMVGPGGDLFAMVYIAKENRIYALNASGKAPSGLTLDFMNANGYKLDPTNYGPGSGMPPYGILTVTVPGAVWGWQELLNRFGSMKFKQVLSPAMRYAKRGFPVSERIAADWLPPNALSATPGSLSGCCQIPDPDTTATWLIGGKPPVAGQIFRNPALANAFGLLAEQGRDAFYKGDIARAIVAKSKALGGTMTMDDLAAYSGDWVEPITTNYKGFVVHELPPPSQAFSAQLMLNILAACEGKVYPGETLGSLGPRDPRYWHLLIEAKKLAFEALYANNADPIVVPSVSESVRKLLTTETARALAAKIDPHKARPPSFPEAKASGAGDTIVLSTADRHGNQVAWVNSLYQLFGSGITVPPFGFILHNRGALFSLDPQSPNVIAPHKRPYNTLSAGFLVQDADAATAQRMSLLLMGGDMQAQGHAQVMVNLVDLGANLQQAVDMARFYHNQVPNEVLLESPLFDLVGEALKRLGHNVQSANGYWMGGAQLVLSTPLAGTKPSSKSRSIKRVLRAGSDHRKDGHAVGY